MEDKNYKVTLRGEGLNLERDVSKQIGEQIAVLILTGLQNTPSAHAPSSAASSPTPISTKSQASHSAGHAHADTATPGTSIREFFNSHHPKRAPDKIASIGVYLKDVMHTGTFTRKDIEAYFEKAAERIPGNLSRDINWAIKTGWIANKSGSKDDFYVTQSGREAVENKFSKEILKTTRLGGGSKRGGKKSARPE